MVNLIIFIACISDKLDTKFYPNRNQLFTKLNFRTLETNNKFYTLVCEIPPSSSSPLYPSPFELGGSRKQTLGPHSTLFSLDIGFPSINLQSLIRSSTSRDVNRFFYKKFFCSIRKPELRVDSLLNTNFNIQLIFHCSKKFFLKYFYSFINNFLTFFSNSKRISL